MSDSAKTQSTENSGDVACCSFCGKPEHEVRKLIHGPSVSICNECVGLCKWIDWDSENNPEKLALTIYPLINRLIKEKTVGPFVKELLGLISRTLNDEIQNLPALRHMSSIDKEDGQYFKDTLDTIGPFIEALQPKKETETAA